MPEPIQSTPQVKDSAGLNSVQSSGYQQTSGSTSVGANSLDSIIQSRGFTTNQDLINYFILELGHGDFNAGAVAAQQYGYNLNTLCGNRDGKISGATTQTATTGPDVTSQSLSKSGNEQTGTSKTKQDNQVGETPGSSSGNSEHCTSGEKVVKYAEQYVGLPYVWGAKGQIIDDNLLGQGSALRNMYGDQYGASYDAILKNYRGSRGFDCSGLCCACYKDALGMDISEGHGWQPQESKAIWTHEGKPDISQLKIGDVIDSPGHYVMYYGNGKAIESCGSLGVTNTRSWDFNGVTKVYRYVND